MGESLHGASCCLSNRRIRVLHKGFDEMANIWRLRLDKCFYCEFARWSVQISHE
ncbi:hypothetical protein J108_21230 [Mycobacteroides abscessus subsp. bolletii CRM-0020]|uniref:Uncharacterized protein n=1 Tax=Mycobacteroides abscessus subsp. bolletii CRM-0020 TaxID=1306401 RepID=A0A829HPR3_9MYCO|nr:hypothetical protein MYCMA_03915 [Mycobacteroides abscessus subsp. massiliense str. GO 06]EHB97404.1 hypothetical protein MAB47J26_20301 [Mycobacteroides abscessus 47J26]EPQ21558.1 hypothetical protein J108_21230 [Mycobacteroides abscessus subsp. bolletii CRM-0020]